MFEKFVEWAKARKTTDGSEFVTVFSDDLDLPLVIPSSHPNYRRIQEQLEIADSGKVREADQKSVVEEIENLADMSKDVGRKFSKLTDRVSVDDGNVFFDGDLADESISHHIIRFLEEGNEDFEPLAFFMEKIASNPSEHSREQLFTWLRANHFSLAVNGDILAYKGVNSEWKSGWKGHAIVNGEEIKHDYIPNKPGSLVEMPRSEVVHDPSNGCGIGLHGASYNYAKGFGNSGHVVELRINPRDIVSVPSSEAQKFRCCRYRVVREVFAPNEEALVLDGK